MNKSPYHYVCLDCHLAPQVSLEGRITLPVVADNYRTAHNHVKKYNHRVAVVNQRRIIVRVQFLNEKNQFASAPWKDAPPF